MKLIKPLFLYINQMHFDWYFICSVNYETTAKIIYLILSNYFKFLSGNHKHLYNISSFNLIFSIFVIYIGNCIYWAFYCIKINHFYFYSYYYGKLFVILFKWRRCSTQLRWYSKLSKYLECCGYSTTGEIGDLKKIKRSI